MSLWQCNLWLILIMNFSLVYYVHLRGLHCLWGLFELSVLFVHCSHSGVTGIVKRFEYNRACVHTYCMIICRQGGWDTLPAVGDGVVGFLLESIRWAIVRLSILFSCCRLASVQLFGSISSNKFIIIKITAQGWIIQIFSCIFRVIDREEIWEMLN